MYNSKNNIIYIPKKNLGQNFLIDKKKIEIIINFLNLKKNENIIEIGPGYGALTKKIYEKINKLFLIEIDKKLFNFLKNIYIKKKHIYIYNYDILKFNFNKIIKKKTKIIGNLPYNISLKIIENLTKYIYVIDKINIMIQKEIYEKIKAKKEENKFYGKLSIKIQLNYKIKNITNLINESFTPKPIIKSNFIQLKQKHKLKNKLINLFHLNNILIQLFNNKRKKINKILSNFFPYKKDLKIKKNTRAENISIYKYIKISNEYSIKNEIK